MQKPTLLKMDPTKVNPGTRIVSEETSEIMCKLMYMVVAQGTGRKAQVKGYEVGGKTGTANTLDGRSYKKGSNMTSMVCSFPMRNPQYIVLIMIDRPQAVKGTYGFNAAGWNAAPVAGKVMSRIAPLLHVAPSVNQNTPSDSDPFMISASAPQNREH